MSYIPPIQHIRDVLIEDEVFNSDVIFGYELPDPKQTATDFTAAIIQTSGTSNPRFTRDELFITIQVMGQTRSEMGLCRDKIYAAYNALLGRDSFTKNNYLYCQFNSTNTPTFVGYVENSKPLFTCSLSLVRESLVKEGNRDPIT